jgi:16S rRNA (cytidine1402-2'-O)-methyltransferase
MEIGKLYIVATPIGNLDDITLRALETFRSVDFVACEDTRVTRNMLNRYDIEVDTISYHQHSSGKKVDEIIKILKSGRDIALVTDAGTPGISDPGNLLIQELIESLGEFDIIPIPGASAVVTALSISGFPTDKFIFLGFPPHKKKRQKFFKEVEANKYTTVFYESCHRIKKALGELNEILEPDREICVCRELTKKFETVYRGYIGEVVEMDMEERGEFVVIVRS